MSNLKNVVPISAGTPEFDPGELMISVGESQLRLRMLPCGGVASIGPGQLIGFPETSIFPQLAKSGRRSDECTGRAERTQGEALHMKTFCIDGEHRIALLTAKGATQGNFCFTSAEELAELVKEWPTARLIETWNALPGAPQVRKFTNRQVAIERIWKAVQHLAPATGKVAVSAKSKVRVAAKQKKAVSPEGSSKKDQVVALLRASTGATIGQLTAATGWQKHSIRGFLSGTVTKKLGLKVISAKAATGERVYRIAQ
jgi:hypothetical protein